MSDAPREFMTRVVRPVECFQEGWELVKDQYWVFVGVGAVGLLLGAVAPLCILLGPMMCGIYLCYLSKMRGEAVKFDTLFRGFDYFIPSLVASLLVMACMFVVMAPIMAMTMIGTFGFAAFMSATPQPDAPVVFPLAFLTVFGLAVAGIMAVSLVVGALYVFVYPLIVDKKLDGIASLKLAIRAGWNNLPGILGLMLIGTVLGFAGMVFCYVGTFLVTPVYFGAMAVAYRRVFPEIAKAAAAEEVNWESPGRA